jgi:hypothetical protein
MARTRTAQCRARLAYNRLHCATSPTSWVRRWKAALRSTHRTVSRNDDKQQQSQQLRFPVTRGSSSAKAGSAHNSRHSVRRLARAASPLLVDVSSVQGPLPCPTWWKQLQHEHERLQLTASIAAQRLWEAGALIKQPTPVAAAVVATHAPHTACRMPAPLAQVALHSTKAPSANIIPRRKKLVHSRAAYQQPLPPLQQPDAFAPASSVPGPTPLSLEQQPLVQLPLASQAACAPALQLFLRTHLHPVLLPFDADGDWSAAQLINCALQQLPLPMQSGLADAAVSLSCGTRRMLRSTAGTCAAALCLVDGSTLQLHVHAPHPLASGLQGGSSSCSCSATAGECTSGAVPMQVDEIEEQDEESEEEEDEEDEEDGEEAEEDDDDTPLLGSPLEKTVEAAQKKKAPKAPRICWCTGVKCQTHRRLVNVKEQSADLLQRSVTHVCLHHWNFMDQSYIMPFPAVDDIDTHVIFRNEFRDKTLFEEAKLFRCCRKLWTPESSDEQAGGKLKTSTHRLVVSTNDPSAIAALNHFSKEGNEVLERVHLSRLRDDAADDATQHWSLSPSAFVSILKSHATNLPESKGRRKSTNRVFDSIKVVFSMPDGQELSLSLHKWRIIMMNEHDYCIDERIFRKPVDTNECPAHKNCVHCMNCTTAPRQMKPRIPTGKERDVIKGLDKRAKRNKNKSTSRGGRSSSSSNSTPSLQTRLERCGRVLVQVPPDGGCLFHTFGLAVGETAQSLREASVDFFRHEKWVNVCPERAELFAVNLAAEPRADGEEPGFSPAEYADYMSDTSHWGGMLDIMALSGVYKLHVVIHDANPPDGIYHPKVYRCSDAGAVERNVVHLVFNGDHYDGAVVADEALATRWDAVQFNAELRRSAGKTPTEEDEEDEEDEEGKEGKDTRKRKRERRSRSSSDSSSSSSREKTKKRGKHSNKDGGTADGEVKKPSNTADISDSSDGSDGSSGVSSSSSSSDSDSSSGSSSEDDGDGSKKKKKKDNGADYVDNSDDTSDEGRASVNSRATNISAAKKQFKFELLGELLRSRRIDASMSCPMPLPDGSPCPIPVELLEFNHVQLHGKRRSKVMNWGAVSAKPMFTIMTELRRNVTFTKDGEATWLYDLICAEHHKMYHHTESEEKRQRSGKSGKLSSARRWMNRWMRRRWRDKCGDECCEWLSTGFPCLWGTRLPLKKGGEYLFDLDHINPIEKVANVSALILGGVKNKQLLLKEREKVRILHASCHKCHTHKPVFDPTLLPPSAPDAVRSAVAAAGAPAAAASSSLDNDAYVSTLADLHAFKEAVASQDLEKQDVLLKKYKRIRGSKPKGKAEGKKETDAAGKTEETFTSDSSVVDEEADILGATAAPSLASSSSSSAAAAAAASASAAPNLTPSGLVAFLMEQSAKYAALTNDDQPPKKKPEKEKKPGKEKEQKVPRLSKAAAALLVQQQEQQQQRQDAIALWHRLHSEISKFDKRSAVNIRLSCLEAIKSATNKLKEFSKRAVYFWSICSSDSSILRELAAITQLLSERSLFVPLDSVVGLLQKVAIELPNPYAHRFWKKLPAEPAPDLILEEQKRRWSTIRRTPAEHQAHGTTRH